MDFVFDRTAEGRVFKCLTVVDDAKHEAVVIEVERASSGMGVTRVMDRLAQMRSAQSNTQRQRRGVLRQGASDKTL